MIIMIFMYSSYIRPLTHVPPANIFSGLFALCRAFCIYTEINFVLKYQVVSNLVYGLCSNMYRKDIRILTIMQMLYNANLNHQCRLHFDLSSKLAVSFVFSCRVRLTSSKTSPSTGSSKSAFSSLKGSQFAFLSRPLHYGMT